MVAVGAIIHAMTSFALEKKTKICMFRHFATNGIFKEYNIDVYFNQTYSYKNDVCDPIMLRERERTKDFIKNMPFDQCYNKELLRFLDHVMFVTYLEKYGLYSLPAIKRVMFWTKENCTNVDLFGKGSTKLIGLNAHDRPDPHPVGYGWVVGWCETRGMNQNASLPEYPLGLYVKQLYTA